MWQLDERPRRHDQPYETQRALDCPLCEYDRSLVRRAFAVLCAVVCVAVVVAVWR